MSPSSQNLEAGFKRLISSFFFRFYVLIIISVISVGGGLDYILYNIQKENSQEHNPYLETIFNYCQRWVVRHSELSLSEKNIELNQQFDIPITLFSLDDLHLDGSFKKKTDSITQVHYESGETAYLKVIAADKLALQIGPIEQPDLEKREGITWIPILYYAVIFLLITLWFVPLRRDLKILSDSVNDFSENYRKPLKSIKKASSIKGLANNIEKMANQIRNLIQGHKELAGAVSHELRTPMARIKFSLENLFEDNKQLEQQAIALTADDINRLVLTSREELCSIKDDVSELDQLIDAMLSYARFDHPDMSVDAQPQDVNLWLVPIITKFSSRQDKELVATIYDKLGCAIFDAYLMEIALSNLLVNAIRYADSTVKLKCAIEGNDLVLDVEDDGEGIPESKRSTVFRAFTRLDVSRNRQTGGYGLGLAIVHRIASLHKGSVSVDQSTLGGAKFTLKIPMYT